MKFHLSRENIDFLKKHAEEACERMHGFVEEDEVVFLINSDDLVDFQLDLNDAIVDVGMNNQDTVNEIGIRLYSIYDELLFQIKHSK